MLVGVADHVGVDEAEVRAADGGALRRELLAQRVGERLRAGLRHRVVGHHPAVQRGGQRGDDEHVAAALDDVRQRGLDGPVDAEQVDLDDALELVRVQRSRPCRRSRRRRWRSRRRCRRSARRSAATTRVERVAVGDVALERGRARRRARRARASSSRGLEARPARARGRAAYSWRADSAPMPRAAPVIMITLIWCCPRSAAGSSSISSCALCARVLAQLDRPAVVLDVPTIAAARRRRRAAGRAASSRSAGTRCGALRRAALRRLRRRRRRRAAGAGAASGCGWRATTARAGRRVGCVAPRRDARRRRSRRQDVGRVVLGLGADAARAVGAAPRASPRRRRSGRAASSASARSTAAASCGGTSGSSSCSSGGASRCCLSASSVSDCAS